MKVTDQLYEIKGKHLREIADQVLKAKENCYRSWHKFKRAVKADSFWVNGFGSTQTVVGFTFKKAPDQILWKRGRRGDYWVPSRKTKEGKELWHKFQALPIWGSELLQQAVRWEDMCVGNSFYGFSWFHYPKKKFYGIKVPIFDNRKTYKPVPGLKPITALTFKRKAV